MGSALGKANPDDFDKAYQRAHRKGLVCEVIEQRADEKSKGGWKHERRVLKSWPDIIGYVDQLRSDQEGERLHVTIAVNVTRFDR